MTVKTYITNLINIYKRKREIKKDKEYITSILGENLHIGYIPDESYREGNMLTMRFNINKKDTPPDGCDTLFELEFDRNASALDVMNEFFKSVDSASAIKYLLYGNNPNIEMIDAPLFRELYKYDLLELFNKALSHQDFFMYKKSDDVVTMKKLSEEFYKSYIDKYGCIKNQDDYIRELSIYMRNNAGSLSFARDRFMVYEINNSMMTK